MTFSKPAAKRSRGDSRGLRPMVTEKDTAQAPRERRLAWWHDSEAWKDDSESRATMRRALRG